MPSGYLSGGKADAGWWMGQVDAAEKFRKKYAHEDRWDVWRRYYRGQWKSDIMPLNLFFSFLRSTVPRVYFRNPAVSVTPARPGNLEMAFAQVVNRVDNKMIRQMDVQGEIKMMVQDAFLFGTADGKLGFGGMPSGMNGEIPRDSKGDRVEYDPKAFSNMPWFRRVPTGNLLVPTGLRSWRDARWVGEATTRPREDVMNDPRFNKKARMAVPATKVEGDRLEGHTPVEMVDLIEIRDSKTGEVIVFAPHSSDSDSDRIMFQGPDSFQRLGHGFPHFIVQFNPDDEVFWAVPDAQILEPHQLEANEIRTQIMKHRRLAIVKIMVQAGKLSDTEAQKMLSEDVSAVVQVDGVPSAVIEKMTTSNIPQDLIVASREQHSDVRETFGFSRNQTGEFQSRRGDTSATEAKIVEEASEIRIDERRDAVAQMLRNMVVMMNEILFERWDGEQVAEVVGPGGAQVWVKFRPEDLKMGHYNVKVEPDSSKPTTRQAREAKAIGIYQLLKDNPMIDPQQITRYLLTEIEGVEMDDLMRALPEQPGQGQGVLDVPQFADLIGQGVQGAQRGQRPRQLGAG